MLERVRCVLLQGKTTREQEDRSPMLLLIGGLQSVQ